MKQSVPLYNSQPNFGFIGLTYKLLSLHDVTNALEPEIEGAALGV